MAALVRVHTQRLIYPIDGMEPMASTQSLVVKLIENKTRGLGLHSATAIAKNIHHNTQVRVPSTLF